MKASYVNSKGARGVIVWDISHDLMETAPGSGVVAGNPLADTLHQVLCGPVSVEEEKPATAIDMAIFPNPASDHVSILVTPIEEGMYTLTLYDILGQELLSKSYDFNKGTNQVTLPVNTIKNGYYFVKVQHQHHSVSKKFIVNH